MKIKSFMTMMVAAVAIVLGMCSCSDDDDEPEVAVATQVEGSYTGNEIIMVMGDESSNETSTYEFVKTSDNSVDMTTPGMGGIGPMSIPALPVKNIILKKNDDNTITGRLGSYAGTVETASGERAYTISNAIIIFKDNAVAVTYSLKYGNMPFDMATTFTGTKEGTSITGTKK